MSNPTPQWLLLLSAAGLLRLVYWAAIVLLYLYRRFLRRGKDLRRAYGAWALITGPTDGIGRALASRLAGEGLNLLLVARSPAKLDATSAELRREHGVEVRTLAVDFSEEDFSRGVRRLREAAEGLDVGVVVNNAGTTHPSALYFHEMGEELWRSIVRVNLDAAAMVTMAVLPGMIERRRGAVVFTGSGATALPSFPFSAVYAATKAYVEQFCRSIHVEYKELGIDVQCQIPMYVATKMVEEKRASFFTATADGYARSAVRWIGREKHCLPYSTHAMAAGLLSLVPDAILNNARLRHGLSRRRRRRGG